MQNASYARRRTKEGLPDAGSIPAASTLFGRGAPSQRGAHRIPCSPLTLRTGNVDSRRLHHCLAMNRLRHCGAHLHLLYFAALRTGDVDSPPPPPCSGDTVALPPLGHCIDWTPCSLLHSVQSMSIPGASTTPRARRGLRTRRSSDSLKFAGAPYSKTRFAAPESSSNFGGDRVLPRHGRTSAFAKGEEPPRATPRHAHEA